MPVSTISHNFGPKKYAFLDVFGDLLKNEAENRKGNPVHYISMLYDHNEPNMAMFESCLVLSFLG